MADWCRIDDMSLPDRDRRLTVHRMQSVRGAISRDSSVVAAVLDQFIAQVEQAADPVWLDYGGWPSGLPDCLYPQLHWTVVLEALSPPLGRLRCLECGEGSLPVPKRLTSLLGEFTARFQLGEYVANPNERQQYTDLPADRAPRERVLAERHAEELRRAAAIKREEESWRRTGVLAGQLAPDAPVYEPPAKVLAEFFPGR